MIIGSDAQTQFTTTAHIMTANSIKAEGEEDKNKFETNDVIDWQVLGKALISLPTTFLVSSRQGVIVQVSIASGHLLRIDQTSIEACGFEMGDALLSTGYGNPGPMTIVFEHPIYGVSTNIQPYTVDDPDYSLSIEAFDRLDCSLNKIKQRGYQETDGGAIPLNIFDSKGRIKKLIIGAKEQGIHIPFAINALKFKTV
jgi:hypothetical protein